MSAVSGADGGFRFDFGDDTANSTDVHPPPFTTDVWPPPSTLLSSFPWVEVGQSTASEWGRAYPSPDSNPDACSSRIATRPQSLTLPAVSADPGHACDSESSSVVCYQTAPEIAQLTQVASEDGPAGKAEGRALPAVEGRDIVPGRYYGGLKVWSCAPDLAHFLFAHRAEWGPRMSGAAPATDSRASTPDPPLVAEVGCGQAIPGLAAILLGARRVVLQDYNAEVLEVCVKPNLGATVLRAAPLSRPLAVKLVHGDWVDLALDTDEPWQPSPVCDVILGADVTFDTEACAKLANLLSRWLRPRDGVALIATKVFYFGTNGGAAEFTECATRRGLQVTQAARIDDDGGMKRVILHVTRPN